MPQKSNTLPKAIDDLPFIFGISELAAIFSCSKNTAREYIKKPHFPKSKVGRKYIIGKKEFLEWMAREMGGGNHQTLL